MRHRKPNLSRFVRRMAVCGVASLFLVGCRSNNRYDLLEAEIRTRERELADTRAQLDQARNLLRAYEAAGMDEVIASVLVVGDDRKSSMERTMRLVASL